MWMLKSIIREQQADAVVPQAPGRWIEAHRLLADNWQGYEGPELGWFYTWGGIHERSDCRHCCSDTVTKKEGQVVPLNVLLVLSYKLIPLELFTFFFLVNPKCCEQLIGNAIAIHFSCCCCSPSSSGQKVDVKADIWGPKSLRSGESLVQLTGEVKKKKRNEKSPQRNPIAS